MTPTDTHRPPPEYARLSNDELVHRIAARKRELGKALVILGHHYQRDEVIQFADFTGDSLKLSRLAAEQRDAKYIVFCGVHFMAESADILSSDEQTVLLPNMRAGCAMADMASDDAVASALDEVTTGDARIIPITYVNSTAAIKALTARHGGACCTSSNVRNVFAWALGSESDGGAGADKLFAIPDQHLARNTAVALGYALDDCAVYNPMLPDGGIPRDRLARAKFLLWSGHCYVHQLFTPEDVRRVREQHPGIRVIVHPECPHEVVQLADAAGSTEQIIRAIREAPAESSWAIGTETNLVLRLAKERSDCTIRVLSDRPAYCAQMAQINLPHLLWVLDNLAAGRVVNQVSVPPAIAADARLALQRMIDIQPVKGLTRA